MKSLLIISNNVLSRTDNNGKTIYNFINKFSSIKISQLYFKNTLPTIKGYDYFQITDKDIFLGKLNPNKRGRNIRTISDVYDFSKKKDNSFFIYKKNIFTIILRELFWKNSWKSQQLEKWLEKIHPDTIFFLAGDSIFPYDICNYIKNKYKCKLFTYITDDYILKRQNELIFYKFFRIIIKNKLINCLSKTQYFFTICERMKKTYKKLLGMDSIVLINRTESLYDKKYSDMSLYNNDQIFLYAGNLYYGRDYILVELAKAIKKYNDEFGETQKRAKLHIYTYSLINKKIFKKLIDTGVVSIFNGINFFDLKVKLNLCNFPVFVESFDMKMIEKTRLSFSTKITEYFSLCKPILAIGPSGIGSMDYLERAAICVFNLKELQTILNKILTTDDLSIYASKALFEYKKLINENKIDKLLFSKGN